MLPCRLQHVARTSNMLPATINMLPGNMLLVSRQHVSLCIQQQTSNKLATILLPATCAGTMLLVAGNKQHVAGNKIVASLLPVCGFSHALELNQCQNQHRLRKTVAWMICVRISASNMAYFAYRVSTAKINLWVQVSITFGSWSKQIFLGINNFTVCIIFLNFA